MFRRMIWSVLGTGFVYVGYKLFSSFFGDEDQTCRTVRKTKIYKNTWVIENFGKIKASNLKSAVFSGTTYDGEYVAWSFLLIPRVGSYYCNDPEVSIKLQCESENAAQEAEIEIEGFDGKFFGAISKAEFKIQRSRILNFCSPKNGSLTLRFKVTFTKLVLYGCRYEKATSAVRELPHSSLVKDYAELLANNQCCDITVKVGQRTFQAHKAVFVARSKVFAAMFQHDMQESQRNEITIPNMNPEVFEEVLRFIYTDNAEKLPRMAYELLEAAEKYDLARLKALCENELLTGITAKTATKTLEFADLYRAEELKARTLQFIASNLREIPNWEAFCSAKPDLVVEILDEIAKGKNRLAPKVKST